MTCQGSCVDTKSDPANCGSCGHACSNGQVCTIGTCAAKCLSGVDCGGRCVDTSSDPTNCGTCGVQCANGLVCLAGKCAMDCGALKQCGSTCVDTNTDPANCGVCGQSCSLTQSCSGGHCASTNIQHVVLIVEENHTFDTYFGLYCNASAGSNPSCTTGPSCCEGAPSTDPSGASPTTLDDGPTSISGTSNESIDRDHDQVCELAQIDNGAMDHYVTGSGITVSNPYEANCSDPRTWALADQSTVGTYWGYATTGALADRYFQPMAGGTSGNDMYFAVAHWQFTDNTLRPNTIGSGCTAPGGTAMELVGTTIADLLVNNGLTFTMYADGYDDAVTAQPHCASSALSGVPLPPDCDSRDQTFDLAGYSPCNYDPSDLPFEYYPQFADQHIVDSSLFAQDVSTGTLPTFAYVKARTYRNEHPGWSTLARGVTFVSQIVDAVESSPYQDNTLVLLTWDEGGGFFDHVPPPPPVDPQHDSDDSGQPIPYGTRVPLLVIGKFARAGTVSHVQMEHSSIVRFLEYNFLGPGSAGALGNRDAVVNNIGSLLDPAATGLQIPEGM